jgi:phage-related minor tail protein
MNMQKEYRKELRAIERERGKIDRQFKLQKQALERALLRALKVWRRQYDRIDRRKLILEGRLG